MNNKQVPVPAPIVAQVVIYSQSSVPTHSKRFEAETALDLELQVSRYLIPTDRATIKLLRGDYPEMFIFPSESTGQFQYFKNVRPTNVGIAA